MDFKKIGDTWVVRIDRGEEIIEVLNSFCKENNIKAGIINGIGSVNHIKLGLFNTSTKEYITKELTGDFEIISLIGNISTMDGRSYLHIHITISDNNFNAFGGHLNAGRVSGTCEVMLTELKGQINRRFNDEVGLNLWELKS